MSQYGDDIPIALIEVKATDDGGVDVEVLDNANVPSKPTLASSDGDAESMHIVLSFEEGDFDFRLQVDDLGARGTIMINGKRCDPLRMRSTEDETIKNTAWRQDPVRAAFGQALNTKDILPALQQFIREHGRSPMALDAHEAIFNFAKHGKLDAATVEQEAQNYLATAEQWGPRMVEAARIGIAFNLAKSKYLPEVALKYVDEAESHLPEDVPEGWRFRIDLSKARALVLSDNEESLETGARILRELAGERDFNKSILTNLAEYVRKHGDQDEALELYGRLAALPPTMNDLQQRRVAQMDHPGANLDPPPLDIFTEIWNAKHNGEQSEGFDEFLDDVYRKHIYSFAQEKAAPRAPDSTNRVVLCELFTGAQCPPCVAADVATGGLEASYHPSELIVLRYHQHIPGPDPLVNEDAEARFLFYRGRGTPHVRLNGAEIERVYGPLEASVARYNSMKHAVDSELAKKSDIELQLSAEAADGQLSISAQVVGPIEEADNLRLRLVVAEDEVAFAASNGIRLHEMVVRSMPGGVEGIAAENGVLRYEETIDLGEFKQRLADYIENYQQGRGVELPSAPLDLTKLHLVAFVQDDSNLEIRQAATIPVSGTLQYPAHEASVDDASDAEVKPADAGTSPSTGPRFPDPPKKPEPANAPAKTE